jgi:hypothetical protein
MRKGEIPRACSGLALGMRRVAAGIKDQPAVGIEKHVPAGGNLFVAPFLYLLFSVA